MPNVTLLHEIDADCKKIYKYVQIHVTQTKSTSDHSQVIDTTI